MDASEAGFSLLEMLVVVAILSLATGLAAPKVMDLSGERALARSATELAALLRRSRAEALRTGSDAAVEIDLKARLAVADWTDRSVILPKDTAIEMLTARQEVITAERATFRFFADGAATGGELRLALRKARMSIGVDWLTGNVERKEVPP